MAHANRISASTIGINFQTISPPGPDFAEYNTIMNVQKAVELQCNNANINFNIINDAAVTIDQTGSSGTILSTTFFNEDGTMLGKDAKTN